ncbi:MAG: PIG-L family deacetylase [Marinoscillum sp.]
MQPRLTIILFTLVFTNQLFAQLLPANSTGNVLQKLDKLNTLGSVLYVAAHPDDENTQLIAYMANGRHYRTGYLAATRGDGGQNLVGPEIREKLGIIRTQELLAARQIDQGEQFFTRANDFGYSKHPDETFNKWDKEKILADFVWAIRKFRPDVLITRFSLEPGVTHGHHTASAILAMEAFEASGDKSRFPEQLKYVDPWQPSKIFWNTSVWFFRRSGQEFNESDYIKVNVGEYNSALGLSYTEISALSRSMHKSQGFGNSGSRGDEYEYFKQWGGEETPDLFGGIDVTWNRVDGAERVAYHLEEARRNYDPRYPQQILENLLAARAELLNLPDQYWKEIKLKEIRETIQAVTGTFLALNSDQPAYVAGDSIQVNLEAIVRNDSKVQLGSIRFDFNDERFIYKLDLEPNQKTAFSYDLVVPGNIALSHPYWLNEAGTDGTYAVSDQLKRGLPQNDPALIGYVTLAMGGQFLEYPVPVNYRYTDPVKGEVVTDVVIRPEVMVNVEDKALIFANDEARVVPVKVISGRDDVAGNVLLNVPNGWTTTPALREFTLANAGDEVSFEFKLTPPKTNSVAEIEAVARIGDKSYSKGRVIIEYDHIPKQVLFPESKVRVVKLDAEKMGTRIGYIMGAGDEVPFSLEQVGYSVTLLGKDDINAKNLASFDAIILGVRAFNTLPWLSYKNKDLFDYVASGGNMIVQYNTSHRLVTEEIAPLELTLSRDRVTVEDSKVTFLAPKHSVLNTPNKITQEDMTGWVQERGLYFPEKWGKEFEPIFGMNDPGEDQLNGSLLIAKFGKGYYCYTGLSFFRELPPGVPGAYKLMMNMIALGKSKNP